MALLDEYIVGVDGPWGDAEAAHLLRRAGFGGPPEERETYIGAGAQSDFLNAVDRLVDIFPRDPYLDQPPSGNPGVFGAPLADLNDADDPGLGLDDIRDPQDENGAIGHWLYRMRFTSQPLQEQLTLFFHDHMVSEGEKIFGVIGNAFNAGNDGSVPQEQQCTTGTLPPDPQRGIKLTIGLMLDQNYLFRETGMDDFRDLLVNITRNPAMLLYLDNITNVRGRPQENYARELMELFSMGVGNYSELDIREIAKALTGETFPRFSCENDYPLEYGFSGFTHEPGDKAVFGETVQASFAGQETIDVIDLILNKVSVSPNVAGLQAPYNDLPATAVYMSWKLLRWFVSPDVQLLPTPDTAVLELAHYLRGSDESAYPARRYPYDIRATLRKLFLSKFFYDPSNRFAIYKTPADFVISTLKGLNVGDTFASQNGPVIYLLLMGMRLFNPPNVAGWNHGKSWLNSGSVIVRYAYAARVAFTIMTAEDGQTVFNLLQINGGPLSGFFDHEGMIDYFAPRLIQDDLTGEERATLLDFLEDFPAELDGVPLDDGGMYARKVIGLVYLMMGMPKFQLK